MLKKLVFHCFILVLVSSCVAMPPPTGLETKEPVSTVSKMIIFTPTATEQIVVAPPTSTERSVIERLEPKVEKVCPSKAGVSINELGLPENIGLFAVHENEFPGNINQSLSYNLLLFSQASPNANEIEISSGSDLVDGVTMSPSGQWMAIFRWRKDGLQESIWIRTIDGKKQWKVADISVKQRMFWISDNEMVVTGVVSEADYEGRIPEEDKMPLFTINPFTLEKHSLAPLPKGTVYDYNSYHSRDGNAYSIYYKKNDEKKTRFLYDYAKGTSTIIFPWIDFSDPTTGVGISPNGFYEVKRKVENGVDFALDLNMEKIIENKNYNDVMKHLSFDNVQDLVISLMISMRKSDILILTRTTNPLDDQKPTPIYLYDYKANLLKDYCLSFVRSSVSINFSPDEQFVALTIAEFVNDWDVYHVLILNLETGHYSVIEKMKAIGFGVIQ